jgi:hypothetical protein
MPPLVADIAPPVWTTPSAMLAYAVLLLVIGLTWLGVRLAYRNGSGRPPPGAGKWDE